MDSVPKGLRVAGVCHSGRDVLYQAPTGMPGSVLVAGGRWRLEWQREKKVASSLGGSRLAEEGARGRLRKIPDNRPWVTAENKTQRGQAKVSRSLSKPSADRVLSTGLLAQSPRQSTAE